MPRPRKYASRAEQQAAYPQRCKDRAVNVTPIEVEVDDDYSDRWDVAVHEAAHAVIHIRSGGTVENIEVFDEADPQGRNGLCRYGEGLIGYMSTVAGHFAALRWGGRTA